MVHILAYKLQSFLNIDHFRHILLTWEMSKPRTYAHFYRGGVGVVLITYLPNYYTYTPSVPLVINVCGLFLRSDDLGPLLKKV